MQSEYIHDRKCCIAWPCIYNTPHNCGACIISITGTSSTYLDKPQMLILYGSNTQQSTQLAKLIQSVFRHGLNDSTIYNMNNSDDNECISNASDNKNTKDSINTSSDNLNISTTHNNNSITHNSNLVANNMKTSSRDDYSSIIEMDNFDFANMLCMKTIIFVCPTYENGTVPRNMVEFWKALRNKHLPVGCLAHLRFAVFGLGDSAYDSFNWCAKKLHNCMIRLGAVPILPSAYGDVRDDRGLMSEFIPWIKVIYQKLCDEELENATLCEKKTSVIKQKVSSVQVNDDATMFDIPYSLVDGGNKAYIKPSNGNALDFILYNKLDPNLLHYIECVYDINFVPQPYYFLLLINLYKNSNIQTDIKNKLLQIYEDYELYCDYVTSTNRTIFEVLMDLRLFVSYEFIHAHFPLINLVPCDYVVEQNIAHCTIVYNKKYVNVDTQEDVDIYIKHNY